ncbi:hypothetical protein BE17_28700 [Sorangium cellulosum]|uniref:Uncharacterized protein n=1 Tax=Sorangium cellulosum TaxID=56 RepID=A0A150S045_SORCE|nr:hypothetical protein BE17_28700 [Sorangium cellulosum]
MAARAAREVEDHRALLDAEPLLDEVGLAANHLPVDLVERAQEVVAEELLPPGALAAHGGLG